ncbi:2-oxoacid:ferredoxin oxidoreductase subunit gamma [Caldicellulosiruptor changbaiensis]|uniref:Pyruvate ferredoxin/flavodoxin oxidoreductase n=2 Tax=Caldicellulosiruptor TaxID=44000 RepID=A4XJQ9_CALS8|nr:MULTISPECIES: 2-oxoacid:acceptor oxidoreductase family protein [Caldicellulosiruptor]ABP67144.1 pyruvate ferredoxin/flavodoxin oxidoreductase [Caldicellulosiruptor saccharolyticus DSM 8903]AZT90713.1 2-oxoacid:ferredoxin oxidoreductase subunit gamma [Caldicellulosiruptor changbaiensis]
MTEEILIAGFGGQGVLFLGQIFAHIGMKKGYNVSWLPSYGPEMRGGTANCSVIISNDMIGSPVVFNPDTLFVLNKPSLEKFEASVKKDGLMLINSSLVDIKAKREDIKTYYIAATEIASKLGSVRVANIVMLGAYLRLKEMFSTSEAKEVLKEFSKTEQIYNLNCRALEEGFECISRRG